MAATPSRRAVEGRPREVSCDLNFGATHQIADPHSLALGKSTFEPFQKHGSSGIELNCSARSEYLPHHRPRITSHLRDVSFLAVTSETAHPPRG